MESYRFDKQVLAFIEESCVPVGVFQYVDHRVETLALSNGYIDIFGYESRKAAYEAAENDLYVKTHPDDTARISDAAHRFATKDEPYDIVYRSYAGEGEYRIIHAVGKHVFLEDGVRLAYVWYTDEGTYNINAADNDTRLDHVFSRALHEGDAYRENYYDVLTGLPNMMNFFAIAEAGKEIIAGRNKTPSILFFNLMDMKAFNTRYGFAVGDQLLREFSRMLVSHFSSDYCSRLGQDHFAVLTEAEGLPEILDSIFNECLMLNNGKTIPVKVGVYVYELGNIDVSAACDCAKMACDRIHGTYASEFRYYDESMLEIAKHRAYVLDNLDRALEERWVRPAYQGVVRSSTGDICGDEALARWVDPDKGMLMPGQFIPVLEDAGLLHRLDMHMVRCVIDDMDVKRRNGISLVPVSVNISLRDLAAIDFAAEVSRMADEANLPHDLLHIEFTESAASNDPDFFRRQVSSLHAAGFEVWMDDFGSGYSSLNTLKDFDFDVVKLDMGFLRGKHGDKARDIIAGVIQVCRRMGLGTLAEGVETQDQALFLEAVGCEMLQGYFYSHVNQMDVILDRCRRGTLMRRELYSESSYWREIGLFNLSNPAENMEGIGVDGEHVAEFPAGVLERRKGKWRFLRANHTFREFLEEKGLVAPNCSNLEAIPVSGQMDSEFFDIVNRPIEQHRWYRIGGRLEYGTGFQFYTSLLASVPGAEAYAIASIPTMFGTALGSYGDVPVPYAVFRAILSESGDEVVDALYVYANDIYCKLYERDSGSLNGRSLSETFANTAPHWFKYCYRATVLGEEIHDTVYSAALGHWITFTAMPSSVDKCCLFAFMITDEEQRERQKVMIGLDTSESIIDVAKTLIGQGEYADVIHTAFKQLGEVVHADRFMLVDLRDGVAKHVFEWCAEGVESQRDVLMNRSAEDWALIGGLFKDRVNTLIPGAEGYEHLSPELRKNLADRDAKSFLAVPVHRGGVLVGYLACDNYEFEKGYDIQKLLEEVAEFAGRRIWLERMIDSLSKK